MHVVDICQLPTYGKSCSCVWIYIYIYVCVCVCACVFVPIKNVCLCKIYESFFFIKKLKRICNKLGLVKYNVRHKKWDIRFLLLVVEEK